MTNMTDEQAELDELHKIMLGAAIYRTVRYQGRLLGNVAIKVTGDTTGVASIDGQSRSVVYKMATRGVNKDTMQWHCKD